MTIKNIEELIAKLPPRQLAAFRAWFYKFDARTWDKQFEEDANTGKLDIVSEKAIEDYKKGRCREL